MKNLKKSRKSLFLFSGGVTAGFLNGLFGAGGGLVAVPLLKSSGLDRKTAHANSVAVIAPLSVLSASLYILNGSVTVADAVPYIPSGVVGAVTGALLLRKIPSGTLRRIFGIFILIAGVRLLLK